jgi:hypothetical protein
LAAQRARPKWEEIMYKVTYKESDWNEIYECGNINMVAALIVDLVNRKGYDESNFKIEWVN